MKTEDSPPVKAELNDDEQNSQDDFLEEDSFMDRFSDAQSDPENDNILPDSDIDKEAETIPFKRQRKRKNPKGHDEDNGTVSDDSDYKPEEEAVGTTSFNQGSGNKRKSAKR